MKGIFLVLAVISVQLLSVQCHTYFSSITVDGHAYAEGDCVRPHPDQNKEYPILNLNGPDMTCGWTPQALQPANRKCPVNAGSSVSIQWYHNSPNTPDDIIAGSHKGPCLVYMAKSESGSGPVWFKIFEEGYNAATGKWCVDNLIANHGKLSFTIPSDISSGNYLLRGELFALHSAYDVGGVQPYVGCAEITISGTGSANPAGVSIPGTYSPRDPGLLFDLYNAFTRYVIPGPALYRSGSTGSAGTPAPATIAPTTAPTNAPATTPGGPSRPNTGATSAPVPATTAPVPATTAPVPATTAPVPATSAPISATPAPANSAQSLKVQLNENSNQWWFALAITNEGQYPITSVETHDSLAIPTFVPMMKTNYGQWEFRASAAFTYPLSLKVYSNSNWIVMVNIILSASSHQIIDTGVSFAIATSPVPATIAPVPATTAPVPATTAPVPATTAPAPATTAPAPATTAPVSATPAPGTSTNEEHVTLVMHSGSSAWWFGVAILHGAIFTQNVEFKDSSVGSTYVGLTSTNWGYWLYAAQSTPVTFPIWVRVTSTTGSVINSLVPTPLSAPVDTGISFP